jgi:hypothetical protein
VTAHGVPLRRLWWLLAGFGVWCSALVFLYALHAIGCAFAWSAGPLRLVLGLILLAHFGAIGWMWRNQTSSRAGQDFGETGAFLHTVVVWTLIAALATILLTLGPTLFLTTCA